MKVIVISFISCPDEEADSLHYLLVVHQKHKMTGCKLDSISFGIQPKKGLFLTFHWILVNRVIILLFYTIFVVLFSCLGVQTQNISPVGC